MEFLGFLFHFTLKEVTSLYDECCGNCSIVATILLDSTDSIWVGTDLNNVYSVASCFLDIPKVVVVY